MATGTPYVTPQIIQNAPTGVSWDIIPSPGAVGASVNAELTNICWRATSQVDRFCRQVLRSTLAVEYLNGPGMPRCNVDGNTGNGVLQARRWPVTEVLAIQLSSSRAFPRVWTPVTSGQWDIRHPLISIGDSASATAPDGGWTIDIAPGWITWGGCGRGIPTPNGWWRGGGGRGGLRVQLAYFNGWPHTSLTEAVSDDETVLSVDDVTGWTGASGFAYDGAATEPLFVESVSATNPITLPNNAGTVQAGPGTITLSSPLNFPHQDGVLISALPADVMQAAILACSMQALEGGIDAITIQDVSGGHSSTGMDTDAMAKMFAEKLGDYRRVM